MARWAASKSLPSSSLSSRAEPSALDTAVAHVALQVDRENVLRARAALLAEADRLDDLLDHEAKWNTRVGLCGGDPVSRDAAAAFNERIDALLEQCRSYNEDLREAARALDATARSYGWADDEIAASFQSRR